MTIGSVRILLVEDDVSYVSLLKSPLTEAEEHSPRFELVHVEHVEQALDHLASNHVDIILLDISQSQELDNLVHIGEQFSDVPIVALLEQDALVQQAVQKGAQDYLLKSRLESEAFVHFLLGNLERFKIRNRMQQYIKDLHARETQFQKLITSNADGIVVVDKDGIVRFVNPAAEILFGHKDQELQGNWFGFPVIAGDKAEIDVWRKGSKSPGVAEMRVVETEWSGDIAYLISLRDITERKNLELSLRDSEHFNRSILNSIDAHIIVLNEDGMIVAANESWTYFAKDYGGPFVDCFGIGQNYLESCKKSFGPFSQKLKGIVSVLKGESDSFDLEYRHKGTEKEEHWFHVRVTPLFGSTQRFAVVSYNDVTERRRAAQAEAEAQANATRVREQEREIRGLLQLSSASHTTVTAGLFGMQPLRDSAPLVFEELVRRYGDLIEMAMEQRAFRVDHDLSEGLRSMAERLGFLKAGPRDVVEIHSTVLKQKSEGANPIKIQAYVEEGRLMVLELMGYLVSYYRNFSLGISRTFTPHQPV